MLKRSKDNGVGRLTIDRPHIHNAFDGELVTRLTEAIEGYLADDGVRVILLGSEGRSFCAGADLAWMKGMVSASEEENTLGASRMGALFRTLDSSPKPVVCRVQGAAIGGGVGLVSCADIVVASTRAKFGLSEVRLGLAPAVISPFVVRKIGESMARRFFLTGERFGAQQARDFGLVHEVVDEEGLDAAVEAIVSHLLQGGPHAQAACKQLARENRLSLEDDALDLANAKLIASLRVSEEGQEGLGSFFDKRAPAWADDEGTQ